MAEVEVSEKYIKKIDELLLLVTDAFFEESSRNKQSLRQQSNEISSELKLLFSTSKNSLDLITRVAEIDHDVTLMYKQRTKLLRYKELLIDFAEKCDK